MGMRAVLHSLDHLSVLLMLVADTAALQHERCKAQAGRGGQQLSITPAMPGSTSLQRAALKRGAAAGGCESPRLPERNEQLGRAETNIDNCIHTHIYSHIWIQMLPIQYKYAQLKCNGSFSRTLPRLIRPPATKAPILREESTWKLVRNVGAPQEHRRVRVQPHAFVQTPAPRAALTIGPSTDPSVADPGSKHKTRGRLHRRTGSR